MISFKPIPAAALHLSFQRFPQTLDVFLADQHVRATYFGTESDTNDRCIATLFCQFEDHHSQSTVRIRERVHRKVIREDALMREVVEAVIRGYFGPEERPGQLSPREGAFRS